MPNSGIEEGLCRREATADILITRPTNGVISLTFVSVHVKIAILSSMNAGATSTALLAVCNHVDVRRVDSGIMNRIMTQPADWLEEVSEIGRISRVCLTLYC